MEFHVINSYPNIQHSNKRWEEELDEKEHLKF